MPIQVEIISAQERLYLGDASMVIAPGIQGELGITPQHAPLMTALKPGELRVQEAAGEEREFFVGGGVLEVQPDKVTVLADTAGRAEDLDEASAIAAMEDAKARLSDQNRSDMEVATAKAELVEAIARVQFVEKFRKRRG